MSGIDDNTMSKAYKSGEMSNKIPWSEKKDETMDIFQRLIVYRPPGKPHSFVIGDNAKTFSRECYY